MDGWMDLLWGKFGWWWGGFDWRGVGWDEFFCFLFFMLVLRWILWAVDDVVEVVGR